MTDQTSPAGLPVVADRATYQAARDTLLAQEKAHTRAGDAIAAARRRLPMEDQCEGCTFYNGQVRELSALHSRDVTFATFSQGPYAQSARYRDFMGWDMPWYSAEDAREALMAGRGSFLLACYLQDGGRVFETYSTTGRGVEVMGSVYGMLDLTVYGRQESWQDSPAGWPVQWDSSTNQLRTNGRPIAQWDRLAAGHSDDLHPAEH
jgi:predicted dithiol-disulfide oxidoreductase (DUF899 family)